MAEPENFDSCGICGRTILRGERVSEFVSPQRERIGVCALCKPAAEDAGWVPAELAGSLSGGEAGRRRGGLRQRLAQASEAARGIARQRRGAGSRDAGSAPAGRTDRAERESREQRSRGAPRPTPRGAELAGGGEERAPEGGEGAGAPEPVAEPRGRRRGERGRRGDAAPPRDPGEAAAAPRSPAPAPEPSPERELRAAVTAFNASHERRKVAGLIRSLGEPSVAVRPRPGGGAIVTVAWELSWYQWRAVGGDGEAVSETAKGSEIDELGERDRDWNASIDSDGTVSLDPAAARRAATEAG